MGNPKSKSDVIRTPDYRLRVFVSSTLNELAEERNAVREAILRLRLAPVMFELGARPHPADDLYIAYLTQSHIFIGIYWQSYGWKAPNKPVSGLEDEYNLSIGLPRLLYIKRPAPNREPALIDLLNRIRNDNVGCYKPFDTADELKELVENDLALLLTERFEAARSKEQPQEQIGLQPLTNVPFPRNPLIGREHELRNGCDLLLRSDVALVTLTGPGGCGKSRLGIQIALELRERFKDGVYLVPLEAITDPGLVIPFIAKTIRAPEDLEGGIWIDALKSFLCTKEILLLLDNFEQVLPAAPQIADLLEACPQAKMLVTSRAPLHLRAEKELHVPPLALPPLKQSYDYQPLSQYAAVQLFIQRAQAVKPDFQITNANAPAVAEICHRLDGLPLAIELASARIRMFSPESLLERLKLSLDLLRGGTRDLPERQQTLRRAIEWSYKLLHEEEKQLLRQLSVFAGGWSFEAADAVCLINGEAPFNMFDGLERLIDLNLIKPPEEVNTELRFKMLETIREFSAQHLLETNEADRVRRLHAQFYLTLVEKADTELWSSGQIHWANRLDVEYTNVRVALEWSKRNAIDVGMKMCRALWRYWEMHNFIAESRVWLEEFIKLSPQPTIERAKVLLSAAASAIYQGDFVPARTHVEEAREIFQSLNDKRGVSSAFNELGLIASYQGDYDTARRSLEESLSIKRELGEQRSIANSINNLGLVACYQKDYKSAYDLFTECLAIFQLLDDISGIAMASGNLGLAAMHLGKLEEARERQNECLFLFNDIGDKDGMAECFERLAMLEIAENHYSQAALWFGVASVLRKEAGTVLPMAEQKEYEHQLAATRSQLGTTQFDSLWADGQSMTLEQAISDALK